MTDLLTFVFALLLACGTVVMGFIAGMAYQNEKDDRTRRGGANEAPTSR